jgi:argininosuccinate synthase
MYEGKYPLSTALARPLISKLLVEIAEKEGADAIAHGCTGKGNDQVRFDVSIAALNPNLKVVAPVREWPMSREDEIKYAEANGIPVPVGVENPFSTDVNLWGRSVECGVLEDPWTEPPEEAFDWTVAPKDAPDEATYVDIEFLEGIPVAVNGEQLSPATLISKLNAIAGKNGVGRIDHIENRLVGIKSREVYECPAATVLTIAHQDLEQLTLTRETSDFKKIIEKEYSKLVYNGLWYSPLREAIDAFVDKTQKTVTGTVKVKLYKGSCCVVGRKSPKSLYHEGLATYDQSDQFNHSHSVGFISLWGLPIKINAMVNGK